MDAELIGQTGRIALQSRRERRVSVLAIEGLTFWHEQERV